MRRPRSDLRSECGLRTSGENVTLPSHMLATAAAQSQLRTVIATAARPSRAGAAPWHSIWADMILLAVELPATTWTVTHTWLAFHQRQRLCVCCCLAAAAEGTLAVSGRAWPAAPLILAGLAVECSMRTHVP